MNLEVHENPISPAIGWALGIAAVVGIGAAILWPRQASAAGSVSGGPTWNYVKWSDPKKAPVVAVGQASDPDVARYLAQMRGEFSRAGIDLNLFRPEEFLVMEDAPGRPLAIPHPSYWPRLIQTIVLVLQPLRLQLKKPIRIHSGYRPEAYNKALKHAAPGSRHMWGEAIDYSADTGDPADDRELARLTAIMYMKNGRAYDMGVGIYGTAAPSMHVDTGYSYRDWADTDYWTDQILAA